MNEFKDIINDLESIENDLSIPKNARLKIRKTIEILSTNEKNINYRSNNIESQSH